uniref:2-(3-amino-3-carboxypropyl)histidine synthase subunit 2 n=1 Tax=Parascaris univalens TaxID=6257 RepID=A0A914ZNC6_PARUN
MDIGPPQLFSRDSIVEHIVERSDTRINALSNIIEKFSHVEFVEFFEIDTTISKIIDGGYKRVALQFPDHFLRFAGSIAERIERESEAKIFILADTSYRSCCIDYLAAEHAKVDYLIHYGDACLSERSNAIPVFYVFGNLSINRRAFIDALKAHSCAFSKNCLLLYDSIYADSASVLINIITEIVDSRLFHCKIVDRTRTPIAAEGRSIISLGRQIESEFVDVADVTVIFVGDEQSALLPLWLMTNINCTKVFSFSPLTLESSFSRSSTSKLLRKRLYLVEKVRDANTLALVVGTVGLDGHKEAIERTRELCKNAAKKLYVLSVGKVNVAKLSNFATDIDAFILLSCPFGVMLDTSDYYRPVVSLFEAEIALNPSKEWAAAAGWTAEFGCFLSDSIGIPSDDDADMSLITGKVRSGHSGQCGQRNDKSDMVLYTAGDYFTDRSWKGLDDSCSSHQEVIKICEGRSGIASSYACEPTNK